MTTLIVQITSESQVTFPASVLDAMGVKPGDQLELTESHGGFMLRPKRVDYSRLGTLRDKVTPGHPPFDIRAFREQPYDPALRN